MANPTPNANPDPGTPSLSSSQQQQQQQQQQSQFSSSSSEGQRSPPNMPKKLLKRLTACFTRLKRSKQDTSQELSRLPQQQASQHADTDPTTNAPAPKLDGIAESPLELPAITAVARPINSSGASRQPAGVNEEADPDAILPAPAPASESKVTETETKYVNVKDALEDRKKLFERLRRSQGESTVGPAKKGEGSELSGSSTTELRALPGSSAAELSALPGNSSGEDDGRQEGLEMMTKGGGKAADPTLDAEAGAEERGSEETVRARPHAGTVRQGEDGQWRLTWDGE